MLNIFKNHFFSLYYFYYLLDNLCQNALDLSNKKLIVDNDWPWEFNCQWLISAKNDSSCITLEFQTIKVS